jgi:hypothetical protein
MVALVDIGNRALQLAGTRTSMSANELATNGSNEAIQINLVIYNLRDEILRMAPWDCAFNFNNLNYITSTPGTPENTSQITQTWVKGQPAPPWSYEYAYPGDCLRACWVVPWLNTGFAGGIPITTAVTSVGMGSPTNWGSPPSPFKIGIDQFYSVATMTLNAPGLGYAVGDLIYLAPGQYSPSNIPTNNPPIGGPAIAQVTGIGALGAITSIAMVNTFAQSQPENIEPLSGQYFSIQPSPMSQSSTTGSGSGATINVTFTATQTDQRVIWTGQEFATLAYVKQVTDPNVMDPLFISAWVHGLAGYVGYQLHGSVQKSNMEIGLANNVIMEARKADGNEGLTVNDVMPDFLRIRGGYSPNFEYSSSIGGFNWGPLLTAF